MPKRTRDRQLAKQAARRQAQRKAAKRRRSLTVGLIAGGLALMMVLAAASILFSANQPATGAVSSAPVSPPASASVSASGSAPPSPCDPTKPPGADATKPTYAQAPPQTIDPNKNYVATMVTSCGVIKMQLLPQIAPVGVNNFVFLANQGYYDGLTFHRVVKDFVIQGGAPRGTKTQGPGYQFKIETSPTQTFDAAGLVAYANSGPDTNGSQFFITLAPQPALDPGANGSFTIFGKVIKGMNVVSTIGSVPTQAGPGCAPNEVCAPTQPVYISSVTISQS